MDGFIENQNIFVLAATNFPKSLDPAAVRSGRFDKTLNIPKPNFKA
jgi:ATP-dependent Zn protease